MLEIIDVHCHFYPKKYVKEMMQRNLYNIQAMPEWDSVDSRITEMNALGIARQVLSPSVPFVYFEDRGLNAYLSNITNDFLCELCQKHPSQFSGFINVPMANTNDAIAEINRYIKNQNIHGISIGTRIGNKSLASPEFIPIFQEMHKIGAIIMIHPVVPDGVAKMEKYQDFYRSVGFLW